MNKKKAEIQPKAAPKAVLFSEAQRCRLANEVFQVVIDNTQSFNEDNLALDLAYLLGAIVEGKEESRVEWCWDDYTPALQTLLETYLPSPHPVWNFIRLHER